MKIIVPELSLVTIIGASGSGKSTFAKKHFKITEILSSDYFRGLISDDENDQSVTGHAFETLHYVMAKRLEFGRLAVCDATNVRKEDRKKLVEIARNYHCIPIAIVLNVPGKVCQQRNESRADRNFGGHVIRNQIGELKRSLRSLKWEGFRHVYVLSSVEEVEAAEIERQPLWNNKKNEHGPFDIIGDVHGCFEELLALLSQLGYSVVPKEDFQFGVGFNVIPPPGRKLIFLGDLVDRGPKVVEVLRLVMSAVQLDVAHCVPGNHDMKLVKKLRGKDVQIKHGLAETLAQLEGNSEEFKNYVRDFFDDLVSHYVFDDGKLVVAHAGMKEEYQGRGSGRVRDFAMYGETTGETDEFGLPIRFNWAEEYRGRAMVVYGHTPVPEPEWLNRTINIDTGCVFGGQLTALRYPENEIISVPSLAVYAESQKPLLKLPTEALSLQQQSDDMLDIDDVIGKRFIRTSLRTSVTIREGNASAALEVMSRFAANPKWIIYLPPTMSPVETSKEQDYLEHPRQAFEYFASNEVREVVCEEKHMGSRAVLIICRDAEIALKRFGITDGSFGVCYTRTGRRFLDNLQLEADLLERVRGALTQASFWENHLTDWICLDCELMPWSLKAQELLKNQYAAVGSAATASLAKASVIMAQTMERLKEVEQLRTNVEQRRRMVSDFITAYRGYCWSVNSIDDVKLAPFHILATEGAVHADKSHQWHMDAIAAFCEFEPKLLVKTPWMVVQTDDAVSIQRGIDWWLEMTSRGGEGMVVKPFQFIAQGRKGLVQPAVKCRGREYLRIIYGPEYTAEENLSRLRARGLSSKRSLAIREFALGVEALQRFVAREPLRKIHECVFGILALESEPVDPRL